MMQSREIASFISQAILVSVLAVVISGCSATRLAYKNADWLIQRGLGEYVSFSNEQSRQLDEALDRHMQWHCETQLPRYMDWLDRVERTASMSPVNPVDVARRILELGDFLQDIAYEITPTTRSLLSQLSDRQVVEMKERMTEKQQELEEKHLQPPLKEQVDKRAERLEKRLQGWLGPLTDKQQARIQDWSQAQSDRNQLWLENRKRWQTALLNALEDRHSTDFHSDISDLLQRPARFHPPEWQLRHHAYRDAATELATDLLQMATDEQRRHLRQTLAKLKADFNALLCR